jgi:hypothetical protein
MDTWYPKLTFFVWVLNYKSDERSRVISEVFPWFFNPLDGNGSQCLHDSSFISVC